ncbi:hypothetical protein SUDANB145_07390 (plasmid) [Streptomyces sp. enrichment culture]|uniref:hypothetical protein n=1 Tax=Streptomyces sp. enrichment culture TaxID=1795815 RepID=UPI003F55602D
MTAPEMVPAAGTVRRLQALVVAGWPLGRVARESGLSPYRMECVLEAATVTAEEARAVAAVFARYSGASPGLCGVSHLHARAARARAHAARWAPAAAWDDDTIDDPDAIPQWTGHCGTVRGALIHERDGLPLCPPCQDALTQRRLRNEAHARRAAAATHA